MTVKELKEGETVKGKFAIRDKDSPREYRTKPGKFFSFLIGDKTGDILAKYWGGADDKRTVATYNSLNIGDVVEITGDVVYDKFERQLVIIINEESNILRKCGGSEYSIEDMLPKTKRNVEEMMDELEEIIASIKTEPLSELLRKFFEDVAFVQCFKETPSAISRHHNYLGGNLEHVLNVTKLCELLCRFYKELDRDLLLTAAILHDIGKLSEYTYMTSFEKTDEGRMLGHIVLGERVLNDKIKEIENFPGELRTKLSHLMLSHHGRVEWGSPLGFKIAEACALHYADEFDARVKEFLQAIEKAVQFPDRWAYIQALGSDVYLGSR